jgi:hypothetical protein
MNALKHGGLSLEASAAKAGISENTALKYRRSGQRPSEMKVGHTWRTRLDPFEEVANEINQLLKIESGLSPKTIFDHFQEKYPGRFPEGQLRSLQRRMKMWRATNGPGKEVFFEQEHLPGDIGASDFCHAGRLRVTISGQFFDHLLYHFVLTYSNWEFVGICFSESLESLSDGFQAALWTLGGVPKRHRTDSLSAAVRNMGAKKDDRDEFTARYRALIAHYGLESEHTQPASPNENGDCEQSHSRFLTRMDQALMLRGSRDFASRSDYQEFLRRHSDKANQNRQDRFAQEYPTLGPLPAKVFDAAKRLNVRVWAGSTIRVVDNAYSVPSRLIGERVAVVVRSETIEVVYAQKMIQCMPRLRGKRGSCIDYRHVIDWLVRKPGAFDHYVYQPALFPTSKFRIAYDLLIATSPIRGKKEYLLILQLAARRGQDGVEDALRHLQESGQKITKEAVLEMISHDAPVPGLRDVHITPVNLMAYDALFGSGATFVSREVTHA